MTETKINSANFDLKLKTILRSKSGKNLVKSRFDLESIKFSERSNFVVNFLVSQKEIEAVTYKVLHWDNDELIREFLDENSGGNECEFKTAYKNGKLPGIVFINEKSIDKKFLEALLIRHFNYEMALEPAFNMRIQLCVNIKHFVIVLDIYDDRGFDAYYIKRENV